ncbi:hypothetical protein ACLMJK_002474 [Lecanora helva]
MNPPQIQKPKPQHKVTPNSMHLPWPSTSPHRCGRLAYDIQTVIPRQIYTYYNLRSQGLTPPLPFSFWSDENAKKENKLYQRDIARRKVAMRFRYVDWKGGDGADGRGEFWPKEATGRCGCVYCRMRWVRGFKKQKGRGKGRGRGGGGRKGSGLLGL